MNDVTFQLLTPIQNMQYQIGSKIVYMITLILFILLCLILTLRIKKKQQKHKKKLFILEIIIYSIFLLLVITSITCINLPKIAKEHGAISPTNMTIQNITYGIQNTPKEDKVPNDNQPKLIIYYRFECNSCKTIYTDLQEQIKEKENIYWVASRSKQGNKLRKKHPVANVPSGVLIQPNKQDIALSLTIKNQNKIVLNEDNIQHLLLSLDYAQEK